MDDDPQERARVYDKIAPLIMAFAHNSGGLTFHAEDLRRYVLARGGQIAPGSPDRILRMMRQAGQLDYTVISRSQSLYQFHINTGNSAMNISIKTKPDELIARFISLRNQRTKADVIFAEWRKTEYDDPMNEIETQLLDLLNETGSESIRTKAGTAFKKLSTSVTTADGAEFRRHIIGLEAWDLVDWRPNKTAINDLIAEGQELPPGLNRSTFYNVNVRVPAKGER